MVTFKNFLIQMPLHMTLNYVPARLNFCDPGPRGLSRDIFGPATFCRATFGCLSNKGKATFGRATYVMPLYQIVMRNAIFVA
jgi:hypothetical protein